MDISIIGAGIVGRALASRIGRAGHSVTVSDIDAEAAKATAHAAGATLAGSTSSAPSPRPSWF